MRAKIPVVARVVTINIQEVPNEFNNSFGCINGFLCFFTIYCNEYAHYIFGQAYRIDK